MNKHLSGLKPNAVWKNFEKLTQIPRPSKKEGRIIQFMREYGERLGLKTFVDEVGNVIISKPASNTLVIILPAYPFSIAVGLIIVKVIFPFIMT
jgi:di/tripeptidase